MKVFVRALAMSDSTRRLSRSLYSQSIRQPNPKLQARLPKPVDLRPSRLSDSSPDTGTVPKHDFSKWGSVVCQASVSAGDHLEVARHSPDFVEMNYKNYNLLSQNITFVGLYNIQIIGH